jgi:hypothetical protein
MRVILILSLLLVAACASHQGTPDPLPLDVTQRVFPSQLSVAPQNPNIPTGEPDDFACPGGFAKGSRIDEYRDGSANLFCN